MLILRLFRYIFGYVRFNAFGGFPERFINLCEHNKIMLWDVRCIDGRINGCTDRGGYKKMRFAARRSGMHLRIKEKCGLPFFLDRHSRRVGVIVGICLCISSLLILSNEIWSIEVTGNERISSEEIISAFEKAGLRIGAAGEKVDEDTIEKEAMKYLDGVLWLNVNIRGSCAVIEVRETVEQPPLEVSDEPTNIVAAKDGQIVIFRPFVGTQEQKIGSAVLEGELLISGFKENKDKTVSFCRADGYVVARTKKYISASQSTVLEAKMPVGERKSVRLDFLVFSVPLTPSVSDGYTEKKRLCLNKVTLPVGVTVTRSIQTEEQKIKLSPERAELVSQLEFQSKCTAEFRYCFAENAETEKVLSEDGCRLSGSFDCLENIGLPERLQIERDEKEARAPQ